MDYSDLLMYVPGLVVLTAIVVFIMAMAGFIAGVNRVEKTIDTVIKTALESLPPLSELAVSRAHKTAHIETELTKCIEQGRGDGPRTSALRRRLQGS